MEPKALARSVVLVSLLSVFTLGPAHGASLTFEQRVAAEEALERVRYSHQIGTTKTFEEAVTRAVLEERVTRALKQSAALETIWATPVTARMLRAEMERQARESRMPERLRELYDALGGDPVLVQECLARPALVERLARNFYQLDERFHAPERAEAEDLRRALVSSGIGASSNDARRHELELTTAVEQEPSEAARVERRELAADEYARWRAEAPRVAGVVGPVRETNDAFTIDVPLEIRADGARVAQFVVAKRSWDDWWPATAPGLDATSVETVADAAGIPTIGRAGAADAFAAPPCQPDDTWTLISDASGIHKRSLHSAVWTGSVMIVWGGKWFTNNNVAVNTGGRYDPATDSWSGLSVTDAPSPRYQHSAVWTGRYMVVWGGLNFTFPYPQTGGIYDPLTDTWWPTSLDGAPSGRYSQGMVWTGSRVLVFGGFDGSTWGNTGGLYDPENDSWSPTSTVGITGRPGTSAVWTGTRMIVLGFNFNPGASYDPVQNQWTPISAIGASNASHAVWIGNALFAWSGTDSGGGARYEPATDTWSPISSTGAPARAPLVLVAAGNRMLAWGGWHSSNPSNTGGRYDPATDTWSPMSTVGAPSSRLDTAGVWTGDRLVIWGGSIGIGPTYLADGARYDPVSDSWTPVGAPGVPPHVERGGIGLWTGSLMLVWGSSNGGNTGGRYDPATDLWTQTSLVNAPPQSGFQRGGVWTGSEMIVWPSGARYEPVSNTWRSMSFLNAPLTATAQVWTGQYVVAWSGTQVVGGRYDPAADQWLGVSTVNAPSARSNFSTVWTGSRMVIWGGSCLATGARYDPVADTWQPTTTTNAPAAKQKHKAVWTGTQMIVAGGECVPYLDFGGRYDPVADAWLPFSSGLSPRTLHTAIWTGHEMVVWGGKDNSYLRTGARYFPDTNTWAATSTINAPAERGDHVAVWTGRRMIVWWGVNAAASQPTVGGMLAFGDARDDDADGTNVCSGDCNDANASVHPGATEACNAIDDDCDALIDEDAAGVDSDSDRIANACDNCVNDRNEAQSDSDGDGEGDPCDANDGSVFVFRTVPGTLEWKPESGAQSYNVYEGDLALLRSGGAYTQAPGSNALAERSCAVAVTSLADAGAPPVGQAIFELVTSVSSGVEGDLGRDGAGNLRANTNPCP